MPKYAQKKCEHGRQKSQCKECGGSQICIHGRQKSTCKECGGSGICDHGRQKSRCKECGGSSFCEHGRQKSQCKECGGSAFCEHGRRKDQCKECGGSQICDHGRQKSTCKECGGSRICKHNKFKSYCKECGGSQICEHDKLKQLCKECGGSQLCKAVHCETRAHNKAYDGYCLRCCIHYRPDIEVVRNYKTKENAVVQHILQHFPDMTWRQDRSIPDGCSKKRPDLMVDLGTHLLICEVDEDKHGGYNTECDHKRTMLLSLDVDHCPIVLVRFNPDGYLCELTGQRVTSCWAANKLGIMTVKKSKVEEWSMRLAKLIEVMQYWARQPTEKIIEMVHLFYE